MAQDTSERPVTRIEGTPGQPAAAPRVQDAPQRPAAEPQPPAQGPAPSTPQPSVPARLSRWFAQTFPTSQNAVIGGLVGLLLALLLFTIGILKTLVIAVLVVAGVAVGQYLDGDAKLIRIVQNLMKKR